MFGSIMGKLVNLDSGRGDPYAKGEVESRVEVQMKSGQDGGRRKMRRGEAPDCVSQINL